MNHYIFNKELCDMVNGTFYYPSETKEDCLGYLYCWSPQSIVTGLLTPVDESTGECSEGETMKSLFEWKEAEWIGGTWALTSWTKRESVAANAVRMTIDFPHLQADVSYSAELSMQTSLQNQVWGGR